jgi:quercetin dioxygenase-like cupin family protein
LQKLHLAQFVDLRVHRERRFRAGSSTGAIGRWRRWTILAQVDGPVPGYTTIVMDVILEPGVTLARHTHPGIESTYVLEGGGFDLLIEGQPTRTVRAGDAIQIPSGTPHGGGKTGDAKTRLLINYMVEKDKPLVNPA